MTEETPVHRAPRGIVLGVGIMVVFYLALWMAWRLLFPAPIAHCRTPVPIATHTESACKAAKATICLCRPR